MSDLIDREEAIDFLGEEPEVWYGVAAEYALREQWRADVSAIKAVPSAEPQWILCSEKLPEDGTEVFVYLFNRPSPYIAWIKDCRWYTEDFEVESEDEPIAWMPLPKPYKEGEQDE